MVHDLHTTLGLPVRGLADCDPFGVMVLHTYQHGSKRGVGGDRCRTDGLGRTATIPSGTTKKRVRRHCPKKCFQS
jgi:hypothetical protein